MTEQKVCTNCNKVFKNVYFDSLLCVDCFMFLHYEEDAVENVSNKRKQVEKSIVDDPDFPVSYPDSMLINNLAYATIRGDFGNAKERSQRLGKHYGAVQAKVNELIDHYRWGKLERARSKYRTGQITIDEYTRRIIKEFS